MLVENIILNEKIKMVKSFGWVWLNLEIYKKYQLINR